MIIPFSQYNFWCFVRKKVIAGNWKMNKTFAEAKTFMDVLLLNYPSSLGCRVLLAPQFPLIGSMIEWSKGKSLEIGVQTIHDQEQGAFTGETSAKLVKEMGATFTLIGHSERRQFFHESGDLIRKKVERALMTNLQPILCIGETLSDRESGKTQEVLQRQLFDALNGFSEEEVRNVVLAYEPVWAIGTGKNATPEMAEEVHLFCRSQISEKWGKDLSSRIPILYGGSVNGANIKALMQKENIDGALVGGASLAPESFLQIIQYNQ